MFFIALSICWSTVTSRTQSLVQGTGKPPLDMGSFANWPALGNAQISNDGKFVFYTVENFVSGTADLVIKSTDLQWGREIERINAYTAVFAADSRCVIFMKPGDSLGILHLGTDVIEYKAAIKTYQVPRQGAGEWIAFQMHYPGNNVILHNLLDGRELEWHGVSDYMFTENGEGLLIQVSGTPADKETFYLHWFDLRKSFDKVIRKGRRVTNFTSNSSGTMLSYLESDVNGFSAWNYEAIAGRETLLVDGDFSGMNGGLHIANIIGYSNDGNRLFVGLKASETPDTKNYQVKVDIWSYLDTLLQTQQSRRGNANNYVGVIDLLKKRLFRLQQNSDLIRSQLPPKNQYNDDHILMMELKGDISERNWNPLSQPSIYLVNTKDGDRRLIGENDGSANFLSYELSPSGRYILYYDASQHNYFSYEVAAGIRRNITKDISTCWTLGSQELPRSSEVNIPVAGWVRNRETVLLYDQQDIWMVDLASKKTPVCITNGYGKKHNIKFRIVINHSSDLFSEKERIILSAFNNETKDNGFYAKNMNDRGDPDALVMGPFLFYDTDIRSFLPFVPLKARHCNIYVVRKESSLEFPNYYFTKDFRTFQPVSDYHPEKKYNWLTSELVTWRMPDGASVKGVLYKPENFDSLKKYPVIIHYYEKLSDQLNLYHVAKACDGDINIPYFVSNGYLVFTPDIHYKTGEPGQSALKAVVSGAGALSTNRWVDSRKIGLQGHSFGGYQTNFIITRTNIFAAACSAAGASDLISVYGGIIQGPGISKKAYYETEQGRIGASLWERPDLYIENSPIFKADKVMTPLLMMNNKADGAVPFSQGLEFFTALRRLRKKVWMLQYDEGGHGVGGIEALDFTTRLMQFFDYYLKDAPAPKWLKDGLPARFKGKDSGLELEGGNNMVK